MLLPKGALVASRFRVLDLLGVGGMGRVYEVEDGSTGRKVALKLLLSEKSTEAHTLRFGREFHTLAQLKHPGVVEVYEFGHSDRGPYYTVALLERDATGYHQSCERLEECYAKTYNPVLMARARRFSLVIPAATARPPGKGADETTAAEMTSTGEELTYTIAAYKPS